MGRRPVPGSRTARSRPDAGRARRGGRRRRWPRAARVAAGVAAAPVRTVAPGRSAAIARISASPRAFPGPATSTVASTARRRRAGPARRDGTAVRPPPQGIPPDGGRRRHGDRASRAAGQRRPRHRHQDAGRHHDQLAVADVGQQRAEHSGADRGGIVPGRAADGGGQPAVQRAARLAVEIGAQPQHRLLRRRVAAHRPQPDRLTGHDQGPQHGPVPQVGDERGAGQAVPDRVQRGQARAPGCPAGPVPSTTARGCSAAAPRCGRAAR